MRNIRLPGCPVTGFRLVYPNNTYSGGTVRDFHPIILFSCVGVTPQAATKWCYSVVIDIVTRRLFPVNI